MRIGWVVAPRDIGPVHSAISPRQTSSTQARSFTTIRAEYPYISLSAHASEAMISATMFSANSVFTNSPRRLRPVVSLAIIGSGKDGMPEISRFYGIVIAMYFNDHGTRIFMRGMRA